MTPDQLFQLANGLALLNWLLLIILPKWEWTGRITVSVVVTILSVLYVYLVFGALRFDDFSSFGSLEGVTQLFTDGNAVLAGWLHYLAFDLMTGWFIVTNSIKHDVNRWAVIPCLLLTFMLGPSGLLLYIIIRTISRRQYFLESAGE
ncbi:MAG: ABA4-like family protein [Saprospiraceae bacterium]|nr:DUF4281 domain-containing protein [Lewinella sp.]